MSVVDPVIELREITDQLPGVPDNVCHLFAEGDPPRTMCGYTFPAGKEGHEARWFGGYCRSCHRPTCVHCERARDAWRQ